MELSDLAEVKTPNPRGQNFELKWSLKKEAFIFSDKLFTTLQLEYNSLSQFAHPDFPVFAVCPGDSGTLMKKIKGQQKTKTMKSKALAKACEKSGYSEGKLTVEAMGEYQGKHYYKILAEQKHQLDLEEVKEEELVADVPPKKDEF